MDRRTKILAGAFLAFITYVLISSVVYPRWIEPMLSIDDRIAEQQERLEELEDSETEVDQAKREYRWFLDRVGSFDEVKVENALRERLNTLIVKHKLEGVNTSGGSGKMTTVGKSGAEMMRLTVDATATLESAIGFLKDVAELPQLARLGNVAIYPSSSSRRNQSKDRMHLRVPIEVLVLPPQRILGERLTDVDLDQPPAYVRHDGRDYSEIWGRVPFTEYVPPKPLVARITGDKNPEQGAKASLKAAATGGDGAYTYGWDPTEGLSDPKSANPTIDTSTLWTRTYTLTVTDGTGQPATSTVAVTVREKPAVDTPTGPRSIIPRPWKDRKDMQVVMTLVHREGDARVGQVMVHNPKIRRTTYHQIGEDFDGGDLVYVHPRGAVVRKEDEWLVYPVGMTLNKGKKVEDAADYPTLRDTANWVREALGASPSESAVDEVGASTKKPTTKPPDEAGRTGEVKPAKPSATTGIPERSSGTDSKASPTLKPKPSEDGRAEEKEPARERTPSSSPRSDEAKKDEGTPDRPGAVSPDVEKAKKRKAARDRAKKHKKAKKPRKGGRRSRARKPKKPSSSDSD